MNMFAQADKKGIENRIDGLEERMEKLKERKKRLLSKLESKKRGIANG